MCESKNRADVMGMGTGVASVSGGDKERWRS